jgi:pimeloyl-ACP methyl ester carboxylesterase
MGGDIVTLLLEQHPTAYDGAMTTCGVVSGNGILDYFLDWALLSGYYSGVDLWPLTLEPEAFEQAIAEEVSPALGTMGGLTEAGEDFAETILHLTGGERPFFVEGFGQSFGANFGVLRDAVRHPGEANAAGDNIGREYAVGAGKETETTELNGRISRVMATATSPWFEDRKGTLEIPLLTLHNTGDLFVPISLEVAYREAVDEAGNGRFLVQRAVRRAGHCAFSQDELRRGFDDLIGWVESGVRPEGDDLAGPLIDVGRAFTEPFEGNDPGGVGAVDVP